MLIYSDQITPRQRYIFDFIFTEILGTAYRLTDRPENYLGHDGPKLAYSLDDPGGGLHFIPEGLLHETGLRPDQPAMTTWEGLPVAFPVKESKGLPFDPFAFAFYLVTRYEEYLPFTPDLHGRFPSSASMACRYGFIDQPVVNILAYRIMSHIAAKFPGITGPEARWDFQPTFDIDIAYAHLAKGKARGMAGLMKLLLTGEFTRLTQRISTIAGRRADPYDNFEFQQKIIGPTGLKPVYFFLLGDFGRYDRNNQPDHPKMKRLISHLARIHEVGLHPSYRSFQEPDQLRKEFRRFAGLTGRHAEMSRQHFLRLRLPATYQTLMEFGVRHDYSMGYSDVNGFRAGTATPFRFYDLKEELETPLVVHPFIFMDSAFIEQLKIPPPEALEEMKRLTGLVARYGGTACGIWHNYALGGEPEFKGWEDVFSEMISYAAQSSR